MKKKILAMLLALVMVISLLPVSVFAAAEEHEHHECPGKDENHTLANCPEAKALAEEKGDCDSWGYTVYQCLECGVKFADKFVDPKDNEHDWEEIEAEVPAGCVTAGTKAVYECTICGETKGGETIEANGTHNWVAFNDFLSSPTICTAKCSECGTKKPAALGHAWGKEPTAILQKDETRPNLDTHAVYTCEDCGKTKEVSIAHDHYEFEEHKAVKPTCTTAGNTYYKQCKECLKYFDANGREIKKDSWILAKLGHDKDVAEADKNKLTDKCVLPTCTEKGLDVYKCTVCKVEYSVELDALNHEWYENPELFVPATCTEWGYSVEGCKKCGEARIKEKFAPLTHTKLEDAEITTTVKYPTCSEPGIVVWNCENCGEEFVAEIDALGCDVKTVKVPATCKKYGYEFTYCARQSCDHCYLNGKTPVTSFTKDGVEYSVAVEGKGVWLHSFTVDAEGGFNPENHTLDPKKSFWVNTGSCTKDGNMMFYCLDCQYHELIVIKAGHEWGEWEIEEDSTCAEEGVQKRVCKRGGCEEEKKIDKKAHTFDETKTQTFAATCSAKSYYLKYCKVCETGNIKVEFGSKLPYDPTKEYLSIEDMVKDHSGIDLEEFDVIEEGDCMTMGLYRYFCDDCDKYVALVVEGTGEGHVEPNWTNMFGYGIYMAPGTSMTFNGVNYKAPKAATCLVDGNTAGYTCTKCGTAVESEVIKAAGKHEIEITKEAKAPTCTEAGWTEGSKCKNCDEVTIESLPLEALGHIYVCFDGREYNCTEYKYQHIGCARCDYEEIVDYRKPVGHDYEETIAPECTEKGEETCKNCGDKQELDALGHKNAAGKPIVESCKDTEEDRVCAQCKQTISNAHKLQTTYGEPTCISYAYILLTCEDCDFNEKIEDKTIGLGDHVWVKAEETRKQPTFQEDGECDWICEICGKYKETDIVDALEGIGTILEVDNALVSGAELTDSGKLVVTLKLDANNVDLWGVKLGMLYDSAAVKFTHAEFVSDLLTNGTANAVELDNDKLKVRADELGMVWIVANAHNTDDKQAQNVNINAPHTLVKLYFDIVVGELPLEPEFEPIALNPNYAPVYHSFFAVAYIEAVNAESDDLSMDIDDIISHVEYGYNFAAYTIVKFMDVNDDGVVNLADALAVYNMITAVEAEYDARADVNKDGVVNAVDFAYLYKYLSYELSYEDMAALKPEA